MPAAQLTKTDHLRWQWARLKTAESSFTVTGVVQLRTYSQRSVWI